MDQYGMNPWNTPRRGIVKVHGEQGAQMLPMQPDDQCIALDETNPEGKTIVWVISTDSRGVKTVCKPYEVSEYIPKPPINIDDVVSSFDERLRKMEEFIYAKLDSGSSVGENAAGDTSAQAKSKT